MLVIVGLSFFLQSNEHDDEKPVDKKPIETQPKKKPADEKPVERQVTMTEEEKPAETKPKGKRNRIIAIVAIVFVTLLIIGVLLPDTDDTNDQDDTLSASEIAAIKTYTNTIIDKLDILYDDFLEGEPQAKKIADEGSAPYYMAIGYMAVVRKTATEVEALNTPTGAEKIRKVASNKLRSLQEGLDEIADKGPEDVKLTDPRTFYGAYLEVLIEIPELKKELRKLADL